MKTLAAALLLMILMGTAASEAKAIVTTTYADNFAVPETQSGYYEERYEARAAEKLKRGLKNFFLGFLEVPQGVKKEYAVRRSEYLPVGIESFFLGLFKGFGNGAKRTAVGFYEIFTFPYVQEPILEEMEEWLY